MTTLTLQRQILFEYVDDEDENMEDMEDMEDIRIAEERLDSLLCGDSTTVSIDEVARRYGLED